MTQLPPDSKLCIGEWTGVICSRRSECARHTEIATAPAHARIYPSLCPGLDHYWPHFVKIAPTPGGPGDTAPLRKRKVSAAEAQKSIAAAMQDMDTGPGADAQGIEGPVAGALAVGARVKVLPSAETGGAKVRQWIGKTGTVQHQVGPEAWDVLFTAKVAKPVTGKAVAEYQSFHFSELEVEA